MLRTSSTTIRLIRVQATRDRLHQSRLAGRRACSSTACTRKLNALGQWGHHLPEAPILCALLGCAWNMVMPQEKLHAVCEGSLETAESSTKIIVRTKKETALKKAKRILRMIRRLIKLAIALAPVAALYPIQALMHSRTEEDAHEIMLASLADKAEIPAGPLGWYFRLCLFCIEWSGAAPIKIMQWAGSRPDLFGPVFCSIFSRLQDDTTPHAWRHTERVLSEAYGDGWEQTIQLGQILGSGCIAQVYKGTVTGGDGKQQEVAVKVMHPHVEDDIDADLDLMRLTLSVLELLPFDVFQNIKWLNLAGLIDEMDHMLKTQLDLRREANNLVQFNENFKDVDLVIFPELIDGFAPTKSLLVETFCEGIPIMEFARRNRQNQELLSSMCLGGIKAVCKMIFLDNFVHADLHPGNVLVTPDNKFVLLDCGIVTEHNREDHRLISDVLAAFIRCDGRKAGRRMIDDSNSRLRGKGDHAIDEELFIDKIEKLTIEAQGKGYLMEKLGTYITYICNSAAKHHVMINQTFISAALAVKVQEGIALVLDPSVEIWRIAIPIILQGERRHGFATERAQQMLRDYWTK